MVPIFCLLALSGFAQVEVDKPATHPRLLLSAISAKPGETIWAGLQMTMDPGWHTYWRNGGDAGIPTSALWTLPAGVTAGDILWPPPAKSATIAEGAPTLYTYEYHDQVVLLVPIKVAPDVKPGPVKMTAKVSWLECKESCVPRQTSVSAEFTVAAEDKPSTNAALLEKWHALLPENSTNTATAQWDGPAGDPSRSIIIDYKSPNKAADFYPYEQQGAEIQGATESLTGEPGHLRLRKLVKKGDGPWPDKFTGLFVSTNAAQNRLALVATIPVQGSIPGHSAALPLELLIAFLAGLILNVMPCVLPVIALKVLGFVNQSKEAPERVKRLGLIYGAGVLVSFAVLAVAAIAAQKAGGDAGWGNALRHPQFRIVLTVLMTLIALNLFGLFEIALNPGVAGSAAGLAARQGYGGAFFNGMLATLLATPCTAPFLAGALAFAFSQPAAVTVAVFLAIGLGLAFPFVVVCWNPRLLKALPKPGAWMEKFKIAMGFPMLGTALWLAYSSTKNQTDMLLLEFFLATLALAAWIWGQFVQRGIRRRGLAAMFSLLVAIAGFFAYRLSSFAGGIEWKTWSPEAVEQARKEGHPVLVDFTAKTCLTCKLNKVFSIEIEQTRAKLREIGAVSLVADFTDEDPVMAGELKKWQGTASVPLVLIYPKDPSRGPEVLPTLLTPAIVLKALDHAVE